MDEAVELSEVEEYVREHVALLAENGEVAAGFVLARMRGARHGWISDLYVSPDFRRGRRGGPAGARSGGDAARAWRGRDRARRSAVERRGARRVRALGLPREQADAGREGAGPRDAPLARGAGAVPRAGVRADGRRDARRQGCRGIHAAAGPLRAHRSPPADQRLDRRGRRALQRRPRPAPPARTGALLPHGRCRADARRGGGSCRALCPLRQGLGRRRVLLAPRVPRAAAAGRRGRPEREPDRCSPADRGRPGARARRGEDRLLGGRAAARRGHSTRSWPTCSECPSRDHAVRRRPLPVLRPRADRPRREVGAVRDRRHRPRRPAGLALREEPGGEGSGARGGRPVHPRVAGDHGAARGAVPRAAALPRGPGPTSARPTGGLALRRRVLARLLRGASRRRRRRGALRVAAGGAGRSTDADALPRRPDVHLADIAWFPWLPRAEAYIGFSLEDYPAIAAWRDRLAERPAIAAEIDVVASLAA